MTFITLYEPINYCFSSGFNELKVSKFLLPYSHRHQDDHKCEKLEVTKPRMAATKELVQKIVGQL